MHSSIMVVLGSVLLSCTMNCGAVVQDLRTAATAVYAPGLNVPESVSTACDWNSQIVQEVIKRGKGTVVVVNDANSRGAGKRLELETFKLIVPQATGSRKTTLALHVNVFVDGKLLATHDVEDSVHPWASTPTCDMLGELAHSLGEDAVDWLQSVELPVCDAACTGLHPDEPIMLGTEVINANADAISDSVRACDWPKEMIKRTIADVNDIDPPLRAPLAVTDQDILKYPGRKLVLKVIEIHVVIGGAFSGYKWMEMSGELIDGGMVAASFHGYEKTRIGSLNNVCVTLNTLSENMYAEIGKWLEKPTLNAELR